MYEQDKNIKKEIENIKRYKQKFWSWKVIELKNLLGGFNSRLDQAEESANSKISHLKLSSWRNNNKKEE